MRVYIISIIVAVFFFSCGKMRSQQVSDPLQDPVVIETGDVRLSAFMCPLWRRDTVPSHWDKLRAFPDRTPVIGHYNEGDPDMTDTEIRFAVEHGIRLFNVCWYRQKANEGNAPVKELFGHWTNSLKSARFSDLIRYSLLYVDEEGSVMGGVRDIDDFRNNLVPYWISEHFKRSNYHRINNKPVFTIYRPENLVKDLGGQEQARNAVMFLREACREAGFDGVILLGEYHGDPKADVSRFYKGLGLDYAVSYHWPSFMPEMKAGAPSADSIISLQEKAWGLLGTATGLPAVPTVSVGWDSTPWGNIYYKGSWRLDGDTYRKLLKLASLYMKSNDFPDKEMNGLLMLDNWNEYAEGHHIFPTKKEGFVYLEAIRDIFRLSK